MMKRNMHILRVTLIKNNINAVYSMIRQNRLPIESPPDTMPHHTFYLPNGNAYDLNKHCFIFSPSPLYCTCQCAKSLRHLEEVSFRVIGIESQENLGYRIAFFLCGHRSWWWHVVNVLSTYQNAEATFSSQWLFLLVTRNCDFWLIRLVAVAKYQRLVLVSCWWWPLLRNTN